jgi:hypothetical protein
LQQWFMLLNQVRQPLHAAGYQSDGGLPSPLSWPITFLAALSGPKPGLQPLKRGGDTRNSTDQACGRERRRPAPEQAKCICQGNHYHQVSGIVPPASKSRARPIFAGQLIDQGISAVSTLSARSAGR